MSFTKNIAQIAKDHLTIGEKRLREALKAIGCQQNKGQRGWTYKGSDIHILDKSIYDFVKASKRQVKAIHNASIETSKEIAVTIETKATESKVNANKRNVEASKKQVNEQLDAIDMLLLQNDNDSKRIYRGFYWDSDIIDVLDSVKHGNKSDLLNEIVRTVLKDKGLLD